MEDLQARPHSRSTGRRRFAFLIDPQVGTWKSLRVDTDFGSSRNQNCELPWQFSLKWKEGALR